MATGGIICRFFNTPRGCWNGDHCRFIHQNDGHDATKEKCRYYSMPSGCRFGDQCFFLHEEPKVSKNTENDTYLKLGFLTQSEGNQTDASDGKLEEIPHDSFQSRASEEHSESDDELEQHENEDSDDDFMFDSEEEKKKKFDEWKKTMDKYEKPKPDIQIAKCSNCDFEAKGDDSFDKIMDHYYEKLLKPSYNSTHKVFIKDPRRKDSTKCLLCDRYFGHCGSLLQHMFAKSCRKDTDGENHRLVIYRGILKPVCFRDTVHHDDKLLNEELSRTLVQDTHEEDLMALFGLCMMSRHFGGIGSGSDDSDYFNSDEYELLCQGIKPWDPEAGAALAVLNGW